MSRMDRYNNTTRVKRSEKNQDLYRDVSHNPRYTNIAEVTNLNSFAIGSSDNKSSRESYQQSRKYRVEETTPRVKKALEDFKFLYQTKDKKSLR